MTNGSNDAAADENAHLHRANRRRTERAREPNKSVRDRSCRCQQRALTSQDRLVLELGSRADRNAICARAAVCIARASIRENETPFSQHIVRSHKPKKQEGRGMGMGKNCLENEK